MTPSRSETAGCMPTDEFFQLLAAGVLGPGLTRQPTERFYALGPAWGHSSLLTIFAWLLDVKRIVELGTGTSIGTKAFMEACRHTGGHVWSVDMVERPGKVELEGDPRVTFVIDRTVDYASKWEGPVDLVYVDADHSALSVENDLKAWHVHKPRLFLVDDTMDINTPVGSPLHGVEKFARAYGWTWWNLPLATGLCVLLPGSITQ